MWYTHSKCQKATTHCYTMGRRRWRILFFICPSTASPNCCHFYKLKSEALSSFLKLRPFKLKSWCNKIVMNSTDCSLLLFDPNIPEVNAYKSVFANCNEPVKILAPFSRQVNEAEILRTTKMFTIDEVAFLDLDLHKNDTFFCKVCVKCFDTRYQWWYSAYANCVKQMHKDLTTGQLICQKHPNQIPTPW